MWSKAFFSGVKRRMREALVQLKSKLGWNVKKGSSPAARRRTLQTVRIFSFYLFIVVSSRFLTIVRRIG